MKQITVNGMTFRVLYAGVSPFIDQLKMQVFYGDFSLGRLAGILDGNESIEYTDGENTETFEGYSRLTEIKYVDGETVVAFFEKGADNGAVSETL